MSRSNRSSLASRTSNGNRSKSWAEIGSPICQVAILGLLGYSAWRYGGAELPVQWQLAVGLSIAAGFGLTVAESRETIPRPRAGLCGLCFLWLLWGWIQTFPLPVAIADAVSPGAAETRADFSPTPEPSDVPTALASEDSSQRKRTISIVPAASRLHWSVTGLGIASLVLGSTLFVTKQGRLILLIGIAANAGAIAIWSVMQRATGSSQVVPGIEQEIFNDAFSTFHYRNAGAAYLLIGLAAAIGILIWNLAEKQLWNFGSSKSSSSSSSYNRSGYWTDLPIVGSIALSLLICLAVLLSLSRGAWICGSIGLLFIAATGLRSVGWRAIAALSVCTLLLITAATFWVAQNQRIEDRSSDLAVGHITADDRFSHFWAGLDAARHYLPTGSGIGTYGFAHLPFKHRDTRSWYENAHNQYLEVITESGVVGIAIVAAGIVLLGRRSWKTFTQSKDPSKIGIGAAGCVALIAVAGQGAVDFVITYPANMMAAGLLLGAVCGCEPRRPKSRFDVAAVASNKTSLLASPAATSPLAWLLLLTIPLLHSQYILGRELHADRILVATTPPGETVIPTRSECLKNSRQLQQLTAEMPDHAVAWEHYAWWQSAELRLHNLAREAANRDLSSGVIPTHQQWIIQSPLGWFETLIASAPQQQALLRDRLAPSEAELRMLRSASESLQRANVANPLIPQVHLSRATLAPWIGEAWQPHVERLTRLAPSNPEQLYLAGLLNYMAGEQAPAIEAWRRYLAIASPRSDTIMQLALQQWDLPTIANRLLPANPQLLLAITGQTMRDESRAELTTLCRNRCLQVIESDPDLSPAERHASYAQLAQLDSQPQQAAEHWENATQAAPKNIDYRLRLASLLLHLGDARSAQKQAYVAKALGGNGQQIDSLIAKIQVQRTRSTSGDGKPPR